MAAPGLGGGKRAAAKPFALFARRTAAVLRRVRSSREFRGINRHAIFSPEKWAHGIRAAPIAANAFALPLDHPRLVRPFVRRHRCNTVSSAFRENALARESRSQLALERHAAKLAVVAGTAPSVFRDAPSSSLSSPPKRVTHAWTG